MRVYLGGEGEAIPEEALPDLTQFDGVVTIVLENGVPFIKADYIALGYDAFEVWCIGAVGGSGGDAYGRKSIPEGAPPSLYTPVSWPYYYTYTPGNPNPITHWYSPFLSGLTAAGGGGGGGGLHRVAGLLADLPDSVSVIVGSAGAHGNDGAAFSDTPLTPAPPYWEYGTPPNEVWDTPHTTFQPVAAGANGGYSSFGTICRASGGKGGRPGIKFVSHVPAVDGAGGAGGKGNSITAGGGAAGSTDGDHDGADGSWDGDIGQGGGGGRGGHSWGMDELEHQLADYTPIPAVHAPVVGTDGGLGSFSYADTSVYGPHQPQQTIVKTFNGAGNPHWTHAPIVESYPNLRGGSGGGAHKDARKFGSNAVGYSPNGLVLIRLIKTG